MNTVLLVSDSHGDNKLLNKILKSYGDVCNVKIHCGDSLNDEFFMKELFDYAVAGNNDSNSLPEYEIVKIENHKILVCHAHTFLGWKQDFMKDLAKAAKKYDCDMVFHGHSHFLSDRTEDGVRIICPGSIFGPRSIYGKTFCILNFYEDGVVENQYINVDNL